MCIRDSLGDGVVHDEVVDLRREPPDDRRRVRVRVVLERARAEPLDPADVAGQLEVCLLYTSDAADERSSVDLGGRRIIKKKKNKTTTERKAERQKKRK